MRIPGTSFEVSLTRRRKAAVGMTYPYPPSSAQIGWLPIASHWNFQRSDRPLTQETLLAYFAVYSCVSLIAGDIAKMELRLMEKDAKGILNEVQSAGKNSPFLPVLRKPNHYQTRIKFFEWWAISKLVHGNTYALKARDGRGIVTELYVLDPCRVRPLISPKGAIFYQLGSDNLSELEQSVVVPASEIIHDVMCPLFHPLCGVSPLTACAPEAIKGIRIQDQSTNFFATGAQPAGVITAPGTISQPQADRVSEQWQKNFSGPENAGKVAVLGDGMTYAPMMVSARDAQLIEQLRWTAEVVCAAFHVPLHKINIGTPPNYNNIEQLDVQYYSQGLQTNIKSIEAVIDDGLGLGPEYGNAYRTEFNRDDLLQMDRVTKVKTHADGVNAWIETPNEARAAFNLPPLPGGDTVYLQQQDFSLAALARRDASADPFASTRETFTGPATEAPPKPEGSTGGKEPAAPPAKILDWGLVRRKAAQLTRDARAAA